MRGDTNPIQFHGTFAGAALAALTLLTSGQAQADYAVPPSWMPMTMLTVSFDTGTQTLSVVDQDTMPAKGGGLYPSYPVLMGINTDAMGKPDLTATAYAEYDPSQPWSVLQDHAFSRQLGWWAGTGDAAVNLQSAIEATYGADASIWIELVSQSEGLETYLAVGKFGVNADNTTTVDPDAGGYTGIFGTDASSTKWQWDYQMDHNTYAVSSAYLSASEVFSATYKVYIGDSAGNELASATGASTLETWTWQAPATLPVPEPETYALMLAGLGLVGGAVRRRKAAR
ncbi:PEPxxWA-CTERM sorting domain-containing protein [Parasulfuritortus cantonensis]|uniref:PEPxxWA-CTERM sorting domain-containing protein n=1 Tax=Parasulfuritortus cantonensis TaxID=2528202 RepID=UPI001F0E48AA|nr:PEPxxWA-CTERM sorting domain-containing protein [Parasulfuritortus cantonensis]